MTKQEQLWQNKHSGDHILMNKIAKFNVTCNCWYQFIIYKDADKVCGQTGHWQGMRPNWPMFAEASGFAAYCLLRLFDKNSATKVNSLKVCFTFLVASQLTYVASQLSCVLNTLFAGTLPWMEVHNFSLRNDQPPAKVECRPLVSPFVLFGPLVDS